MRESLSKIFIVNISFIDSAFVIARGYIFISSNFKPNITFNFIVNFRYSVREKIGQTKHPSLLSNCQNHVTFLKKILRKIMEEMCGKQTVHSQKFPPILRFLRHA